MRVRKLLCFTLFTILISQSVFAEGTSDILSHSSRFSSYGGLDEETYDFFGCEEGMHDMASRYPGCESFVLYNGECDADSLRYCIYQRDQGALPGQDHGDDCPECGKTNWGETLLGMTAILSGPLASYGINKQWADAYQGIGESRWNAFGQYADALKEFPQQCTNGFDSYLDYRTNLGINSALSSEGVSGFYESCSGLMQYAGFQGLFANGFGGGGNVWGGGGYSQGFLNGMFGPPFGGGGQFGGGGIYGSFGAGMGGFPGGGSLGAALLGGLLGGGVNFGINVGAGVGSPYGYGFPGVYPGFGVGTGVGGMFPGMGYPGVGMGYPGVGAGVGGGFPGMGFPGVGYPGVGVGGVIGGGVGLPGGGFPGAGFPGAGVGGNVFLGGQIGTPGIFPGGGIHMGYPGANSGAFMCIQAPCPGAGGGYNVGNFPGFGGGAYGGYHMGVPGYNPNGGFWSGATGTVPWMNGGGGYWAGTGGWNNGNGVWNGNYNQWNNQYQNQYQQYMNQQQLNQRQNQALAARGAAAYQGAALGSRGLYENYYNAGLDYYGGGHLSGGVYGGAPFAAGNLGASFGLGFQ